MNWAFLSALINVVSPPPVHYCCYFGMRQETRIIQACGNSKILAVLNGSQIEFKDKSFAIESVLKNKPTYSVLMVGEREVIAACEEKVR